MSGFFEELKRRKVYRVAIAYVIASWALAQGVAQVLPVFDIPNSVIRSVIALMLMGLPIALDHAKRDQHYQIATTARYGHARRRSRADTLRSDVEHQGQSRVNRRRTF